MSSSSTPDGGPQSLGHPLLQPLVPWRNSGNEFAAAAKRALGLSANPQSLMDAVAAATCLFVEVDEGVNHLGVLDQIIFTCRSAEIRPRWEERLRANVGQIMAKCRELFLKTQNLNIPTVGDCPLEESSGWDEFSLGSPWGGLHADQMRAWPIVATTASAISDLIEVNAKLCDVSWMTSQGRSASQVLKDVIRCNMEFPLQYVACPRWWKSCRRALLDLIQDACDEVFPITASDEIDLPKRVMREWNFELRDLVGEAWRVCQFLLPVDLEGEAADEARCRAHEIRSRLIDMRGELHSAEGLAARGQSPSAKAPLKKNSPRKRAGRRRLEESNPILLQIYDRIVGLRAKGMRRGKIVETLKSDKNVVDQLRGLGLKPTDKLVQRAAAFNRIRAQRNK